MEWKKIADVTEIECGSTPTEDLTGWTAIDPITSVRLETPDGKIFEGSLADFDPDTGAAILDRVREV